MIIKRYLVNNMNEAMTRIRYELGKDAIIISQRKIKKPGMGGFFSKKMLEVTAAVENSDKTEEIKNDIEAIKDVIKKDVLKNQKVIEEETEETEEKKDKTPDNSSIQDTLIQEMQEMKAMINDMTSKNQTKTVRKSKVVTTLENFDCCDKVIKSITARMGKIKKVVNEEEKLKLAIKNMINIDKTELNGPVVLVGPTGVGKTTTIAKLAGNLLLIKKKKVGLITIDTYRIGAVEQLKTYAEIMNIPFKVVLTTKEMEEAVESMKNCDVILIDTTGRSSKNSMQISELRAFIEKANTENIHLVISSTTKTKDIEGIIKGYEPLKYKYVMIAKLDETSTYGSILNILYHSKRPLSFVTTGQNVPDDIKELNEEEICKLVLGEDTIC